jgi:hypothetical protein
VRYGYCHYEWLTGGNAAACQCGSGPVALSTPPVQIPVQDSFYSKLVCNAAPCGNRATGRPLSLTVTAEEYAQQCASPPCQVPCLVGGCPKYALAPSPPGSRPRSAYLVGPEDTDALPRLGCRVKGCPGWVPPGQLVCRGVDCLTNGEGRAGGGGGGKGGPGGGVVGGEGGSKRPTGKWPEQRGDAGVQRGGGMKLEYVQMGKHGMEGGWGINYSLSTALT